MLARLLALLLALMPVPAVAQEMTRAQAAPYLGMYLFKDGSFAELSWLEDIPAPLLTDYPDGIIRALRPDGPGRFTAGPTAAVPDPVQIRLAVHGDRLDLTRDGRTRSAMRIHFHEEVVGFNSGDVHLGGTLTLPNGKGPFPAVVLIHGGGPQTRDFLWVANFFAHAGVAVLAYDKRGVGASTGDWRSAQATDLARDALAGVAFLRARRDIDAGRIGLYGSSNGGWVAPIAAATEPKWIAFVIARSASGFPERENVVFEVESDLRAAGYEEGVIQRVRALHERFIHAFQTDGDGWNSLVADLSAASPEPWYRLARFPSDLVPMSDKSRDALRGSWAWYRAGWLDPAHYWEQLGCPVLAQTGTSDRYVPAERSAAIIRSALERAGNRDATMRLYLNGDHGLFESPGGTLKDIAKVTRFVPGYRQDLRAFIDQYVAGPHAPRGRGCGRR
jgi:hypothetical protein